jgi:hypothetical protein
MRLIVTFWLDPKSNQKDQGAVKKLKTPSFRFKALSLKPD